MRRIGQKAEQEIIRLRKEDRRSIPEIARRLRISVTTVSSRVKGLPYITRKEKAYRRRNWAKSKKFKIAKPSDSKFSVLVKNLSRHQKAKAAELAVSLRLVFNGFEVFAPFSSWDSTDLLVISRKGLPLRVQVKWIRWTSQGWPRISLTKRFKMRQAQKYKEGDFDFIVGYDGFCDNAYVYSWEEVKGKRGLSVNPCSLERFDKLKV